ncbi:right-handed parallel beta-helix repeat-containing protein [Microbacteriaceae bacterium 4G12]
MSTNEIRVSKRLFSKYKTINQAIQIAKPGTKIIVEPGTYNESLIFNKDIEIIGEGPVEKIILCSTNSTTVFMNTDYARLSGLTIRCEGLEEDNQSYSVDIPQGTLLLQDCHISSMGSCIHIRNANTNPTIQRCIISNNGNDGCGILIGNNAQGIIEGCFIYENGYSNIIIMGGANPLIRDCKIYSSNQNGVWVKNQGRGTIENCEIYCNAYPNIQIAEQGNPMIRSCYIYEGQQNGVWIKEQGRGTIENCEIYDNASANIEIVTKGNPVIRNSKIYNGERSGIWIDSEACGTIENCEIYSNTYANIGISTQADPVIRSCYIYEGQQNGVWIKEQGRGTIENCEIYGNVYANIEITTKGDPIINGCKISNGKGSGVWISDQGFGTIENCEVYSNTHANIGIVAQADPVIRSCYIYEGQQSGVWVKDQGRGTIEDCEIYGNVFENIEINTEGDPVIRKCKISNGKSSGVWVSDKGFGTIENCELYSNTYTNIGIVAQADPVIRGCNIYEGQQSGVWVKDQGRGTIENCEIYGNAYANIEIITEGDPLIRNCRIYKGEQSGVWVKDQGRGTIENCEIYGNAYANIEIITEGDPLIRNCRIYNGQQEGVYVENRGRGTLEGCQIFENALDNIKCSTDSTTTIVDGKEERASHIDTLKAAKVDEHIQRTKGQSEIFEKAIGKLDKMIGLTAIKTEIKNLVMELEGRKKAEALGGIKAPAPTLHMMFTGSPGTGKTEVARVIVEILHGMGYLRTGAFVEVDRSRIVGKHIGHTEDNMKTILEQAAGGVLFIDEAYALAGEGNDFGKEAIDVLIKAMEDRRDDLVVILAGYQVDMERLLNMNEGFRSRIPYRFEFPDYTPKELAILMKRMLENNGYNCNLVEEEFEKEAVSTSKNGRIEGNGRWARNIVQQIIKQHNIRIALQENDKNIGRILVEDIYKATGRDINANVVDSHKVEGLRKIREEALVELNNMVGLEPVKMEVQRILNFITVEQRRMKQGYTSDKMSMHMIFAGPPGTGKTTVARIVGKFLKGTGVLSSGNFVEADRSKIVGKYIGHTEDNMKNLLDKAAGGILFIDEAYALAKGSENDFGKEAIDVLIKAMEDRRDDLVVILAGYEVEMQQLMEMNPGFESRIPYNITFPNYSSDEITQIIKLQLTSKQFHFNEQAEHVLDQVIADFAKQQNEVFSGNGRWARNVVEQIRMEQNNRLVFSDTEDLMEITEEDIRQTFQRMGVVISH